jgi:hypothetical protein
MSEEKNIEPSADDSLQTTESENISEQQTKNYKLKIWKYIIIHT